RLGACVRELRAKLFHRQAGRERSGPAAAQQRPDPEPADQQREEPFHVVDATVPPLLVTPVAPSTRSGVQGAGPPKSMGSLTARRFGQMNEYEIMFLLDPELAEVQGDAIIQRIRDSVEGAGGTWDGHTPWGRRRLAYEIGHKGEAI